ncbi:uncharacterized protein LOC111267284 isoform X1 [Varroa jacobsoni]|uniref:uncharacterized protein LOC111267284 isoform X1 n=2 Tax=Varroa jacobsoni TaxID=62625 RepID=UPI000BF3D581|nr:uncharacterized protein LOC111267284 isoform X1 [Varroa jacobsoni]
MLFLRFTETAKQEGQVMFDNRQIIPGWGGPIGPWGGWGGGWPWYGGISTVMFAALIYSLSVLPAMMQLFNHYHSYHHHGPPHRSPVSNFVHGFLGIKRRSDNGGDEFDLPDTLLRMASSDTLGRGLKIAKNIITEWPAASNDCKAMYVCQLTREIISLSTNEGDSENEVRQKRDTEGRGEHDECVTKFKKCRRDVLFS